MKALAVWGLVLCVAFASGCSTSKETADSVYSQRFPAGKARAFSSTEDGSPRMYRANGAKASRVSKAAVTHPADKTAPLAEHDHAQKLDPSEIGADKLSMQDYNRYAYRKGNRSEEGVPVTTAGEKSDKNVKK
jgi:hypothetical protein